MVINPEYELQLSLISTQPFPFVMHPGKAVSQSKSVVRVVGSELHKVF